MRLSVGRTGVCWDNAQQESFWSTLKTEYYQRHSFATHADAIRTVSSWIETVYNRRRRHSALGQISPVAFEQLNHQRATMGLTPFRGHRLSGLRGRGDELAARCVVAGGRPEVRRLDRWLRSTAARCLDPRSRSG